MPAGAGGATDQMARVIQSIISKYKLMKQSIIIQLKGGASGAEGIMDVKASAGDPHKFLIASSAIYTIPLATDLPFNWRDLTPVALIAMDEFILWVNADTPYKTPKEYLAVVKTAPEKFKMGGTGSKREDHIITAAIEKSQGVKFTYIPTRAVARFRPSLSATTSTPTSTIPPRASRNGGQAKSEPCAFSTLSACRSRPR